MRWMRQREEGGMCLSHAPYAPHVRLELVALALQHLRAHVQRGAHLQGYKGHRVRMNKLCPTSAGGTWPSCLAPTANTPTVVWLRTFEKAWMVSALNMRPRPRSPTFTVPSRVRKMFAGCVSKHTHTCRCEARAFKWDCPRKRSCSRTRAHAPSDLDASHAECACSSQL